MNHKEVVSRIQDELEYAIINNELDLQTLRAAIVGTQDTNRAAVYNEKAQEIEDVLEMLYKKRGLLENGYIKNQDNQKKTSENA